uniref:C1q domain-containing protein n=1 Tax=Poecilia latipinna TaxID=48699 RepID=A0A3B3UTI9_9TELE
MKIALFYLMLLLVGSVSTDQSKDCGSSSGEIHEALREMAASLTELKIEVETLKKENTGMILGSLILLTWGNLTNVQVKPDVTQVAFSAYLSEGHFVLGPFSTYTAVTLFGIFTAPVRGAYHFELHVGGLGAGHGSGASITKNGERTFIAIEHQTNGVSSASNSITLILQVGDQVSVSLFPGAAMFDNENDHSTFSGHLLFNM